MRRNYTDRRDRIRSALLVAVIHVALGWALISSLGYKVIPRADDALKLFNLTDPVPPPLPPPPEPAPRPTRKPKDPAGAAATPAKRSTPTEIKAPPTKLPTPIPAARQPGQGSAAAAGAAPIDGPGTGRGGIGDGLGSGLSGNGNGGGGNGGRASLAWQIAGDIDNAEDYPRDALKNGKHGTTYFAYLVGTDGLLKGCRITRSSGSRLLDDTTCRLAIARFRFRPALDTAGRPVASEVRGDQKWVLGPVEDITDRPERR